MLRASAFVPGHVTGFFNIQDKAEDIRQRGSKGAGICLSKGVYTEVEVLGGEGQEIEILINKSKARAQVTRLAVETILGGEPLKIRISSSLELPQGQGFGMSGAGALSSALALVKALDMDMSTDEIVCAAHEAEITCSTGLGDVMPQSVGGVVIRRTEGCSPFGMVENLEVEDKEVVLCVIGKELPTKDIITNPGLRTRISEHGDTCLKELSRNPGLEEMMRLSLAFSRGIGLLSQEIEDAVSAASKFGLASMSMLGNSIFAVGDTEQLENVLSNFGEMYICQIDYNGMRLVEGK